PTTKIEIISHPYRDTQPLKDWSSGLFDCGENASTCCYGFWCCPCLACTVSEKFGENRCLPLCDMVGPAITALIFGIPVGAVPPAGLSLRAAMRTRYAIEGTLCRDIVISCFCGWCNWCQMHREKVIVYYKNIYIYCIVCGKK
uniref:Cornifelin n=1 Tax=Sander lucioperca TaxID=283035 RepID=A0A8C9YGG5_SANLU